MKALGVVRKLDGLGRVVIPKEVRDTQGWKEGQPMEMFVQVDSLILKPYNKKKIDKNEVITTLITTKQALDLHGNNELRKQLEKAIDDLKQLL